LAKKYASKKDTRVKKQHNRGQKNEINGGGVRTQRQGGEFFGKKKLGSKVSVGHTTDQKIANGGLAAKTWGGSMWKRGKAGPKFGESECIRERKGKGKEGWEVRGRKKGRCVEIRGKGGFSWNGKLI